MLCNFIICSTNMRLDSPSQDTLRLPNRPTQEALLTVITNILVLTGLSGVIIIRLCYEGLHGGQRGNTLKQCFTSPASSLGVKRVGWPSWHAILHNVPHSISSSAWVQFSKSISNTRSWKTAFSGRTLAHFDGVDKAKPPPRPPPIISQARLHGHGSPLFTPGVPIRTALMALHNSSGSAFVRIAGAIIITDYYRQAFISHT